MPLRRTRPEPQSLRTSPKSPLFCRHIWAAGGALVIALGVVPMTGLCQQREYNFHSPAQTPSAQPSNTNQVLEVSVPHQFHGCWAGDLDTNNQKFGVHQHAKLCFTNRTWSFDISRPDMDLSALGMEWIPSPPQRQMTGAGENWVGWNAIWKYEVRKGTAQINVTNENHWRCELTADHQALWCQDSVNNYINDALGHNLARQHQYSVRMAKEDQR